jgi:hypothetical protein
MVWQCGDKAHEIQVHFWVKPTIVKVPSLIDSDLQPLGHVSTADQF